MTILPVATMPANRPSPALVPAVDVSGAGPHFVALSRRPWLQIEPFSRFGRRRWVRLRYRLSLYDRPTRPILSFRRDLAGTSEEIGWCLLPGPVLGRGEGLAIAPDGASAAWISPVAQKGPFGFVIEAIESLSPADIVRLGMSGDRRRFFGALATFAVGWRAEAELNFRWATQHAPMASWRSYGEARAVAADLTGLERPRCDWAAAPTVRLLARLEDDTPAEHIEQTLAALKAQIFPRWSLSISGGGRAAAVAADPRIVCRSGAGLDGDDGDLAGFLAFGDRPAPHALASFIEAIDRAPAALAAYCDEERAGEPVLKPDWSPRLQAAMPYVGRLLLTRFSHARKRVSSGQNLIAADLINEDQFVRKILAGLGRKEILHLPRVLIETLSRDPCIPPPAPRENSVYPPHVTIVMPTRDGASMLRRSIASLFARTEYPAFDLVIVDNGSTEEAALAALAEAGRDARVKRVNAPGVFNFARLCNLGALDAKGAVVVFLNNDVEIIEPHWLGELASRASCPEVGAVGCMLLYPDGRIQHAGVVVGMGEGGGHGDAGFGAGAAGWLQRNWTDHEISAVTGACLAVERAKFMAAGGFDEVCLPVEFNDIDLCLRLEELGFATLFTPFARITHFESASRGKATFRRLRAHAAERANFQRRWMDRLRDDPFYHPGLSLFSLATALA